MTDLKPCPFCGTSLIRNSYFSRRNADCYVHAQDLKGVDYGRCPAAGVRIFSNEPDRISLWNTRAPVLVERLGEIDDAMVKRAAMALTGARWDNGHKLVSGETLSAREMATTEARAALVAALTSTTSTETTGAKARDGL